MAEKLMNFFMTFVIFCAILGFAWSTVNYYSIKSLQVEISELKTQINSLEHR